MKVKTKTLAWKQLSHSAWLAILQSRRHGPGGFYGFSPAKETSKPSQTETWNTMNQWSFCQFLNVNSPAQTQSPLVENFLATVLPYWHVLFPVFSVVMYGFCLLFGWMLFLAFNPALHKGQTSGVPVYPRPKHQSIAEKFRSLRFYINATL